MSALSVRCGSYRSGLVTVCRSSASVAGTDQPAFFSRRTPLNFFFAGAFF